MKVLIDNCVPLNNGDAALIFALKKGFNKKNSIELNCLNYKEVKKRYPNEVWHPSLINNTFHSFFKKIPFLGLKIWKIFIAIYLFAFNNPYKKSDLIISAPGGYIHSYYGIESRMFILYFCKKYLKKNVGIYSQSIGDLSEKDQKIFEKYGCVLDFIYLRDEISFKRAQDYGLKDNIKLTKDAAFLLFEKSELNYLNKRNKKIAISMREWNKEGRGKTKYFDLINKIVTILLKHNYQIEFISTCQGLPDYVDDSKVAEEFVEYYKYNNNRNINIDSTYYNLKELQEKLVEYDFVFGTRLHMCILSLINGTLAFNISYEEKGKECYKYLKLDDFTLDYNNIEDCSEVIEKFLNINHKESQKTEENVIKVSNQQKEIFENMIKKFQIF